MTQQLLLSIGRREDKTFDNYHTAGNEVAVADLRELARIGIGNSDSRQLYLWGESTTGKSHLLQAVCRTADKCGHRSAYLPLAEVMDYEPAEVFEGLDHFDMLCLDDMEAVLSKEAWQHGLFGLINLRRNVSGALVMAGQANPLQIPLPFKDLSSRLKWSVVYHLAMPEDHDKGLILRDIAQRSGAELPAEVVSYMLNNHRRDFAYLVDLIQLSVLTAQREKRQMTIPFMRRMLENPPAD